MLKMQQNRVARSWMLLGLVLVVTAPVSGYAMNVTLEWDPSPSSDVTGYKLYYKDGYSGPPYDGAEAYEGDSPIDVGDGTDFTLSGLDSTRTYYFVVTAYNSQSMESGPSNEVSTGGASGAPEPPPSEDVPSASTRASGGGGGGGCFVNAAAAADRAALRAWLLLFLVCVSVGATWKRIGR